MEKNKLKLIMFVCVFIVLPVVFILMTKLEGEKPYVILTMPSGIGVSQNLSISLSDAKSGMRRIWVGLLKDGREFVFLKKEFPSGGFFGGGKVNEISLDVPIQPQASGITEGKGILRIVARDFSWRGWWNGNKTLVEKEMVVDTHPPQIDILSRSHSIRQGGSCLVIYRVSEPCPENGVYVGKNFFPVYSFRNVIGNPSEDDADIFMAFIALSYEQGRGTDIFIRATDPSGNSIRTDLPSLYIGNKSFKKDTINISDRFLDRKMPEFFLPPAPGTGEAQQNPPTSRLEKFIRINNEIRKANYRKFVEITEKSDDVLYLKGGFRQLPKSAAMASFADHREYRYKGRVIDHQVHKGLDLASVAHSPVPAGNSGKVVFAGDIGIYGKTVVIDHGFGLFSTYSHLSIFNVKEGQLVSRGETIGKTGKTGLAGGDHLHFGIFVHNTFVNPIEWLDRAWVRDNIFNKIKAVKSRLKQ